MGVATLCRETTQLHPRLRADLVLAAALVHDVGRTIELGRGPAFTPTEEGELPGHVLFGLRVIDQHVMHPRPSSRQELPDGRFRPQGMQQLDAALAHLQRGGLDPGQAASRGARAARRRAAGRSRSQRRGPRRRSRDGGFDLPLGRERYPAGSARTTPTVSEARDPAWPDEHPRPGRRGSASPCRRYRDPVERRTVQGQHAPGLGVPVIGELRLLAVTQALGPRTARSCPRAMCADWTDSPIPHSKTIDRAIWAALEIGDGAVRRRPARACRAARPGRARPS